MNQYANPYLNQYGMQPQNYQFPAGPQMQVTKVKGEQGALSIPMGPNSSFIALDESGKIAWLVISDAIGCKTASPYDISPHQELPKPDLNTLEARITKLEAMINATGTADPAATRKKSAAKPDDGEG